jgi:hypothetical protein
VIRLFSFLADKADVPVTVSIGETKIAMPPFVPARTTTMQRAAAPIAAPAPTSGEAVNVPLIALAYGRSGDKGDIANIGVLARHPHFVPVLRRELSSAVVRDYFSHYVKGPVERFEWPGLNGFNFLLHQALGGGGVASLRHDPQGKALAQILMDCPVAVPAAWVALGGPLEAYAPGESKP